MLMDFQIEGGQAATAEIIADRSDIPYHQLPRAYEQRSFKPLSPVWTVMIATVIALIVILV